jgi:protein SCO1
MTKSDAWPLGAIGFILIVSVLWWLMALGSVQDAPEWLERARSVCFNVGETGLPDTKGWLLLVGQPPAMIALLMVGWGNEVRASLGRLTSRARGRAALTFVAMALLTGLALAAARVAEARIPEIAFGRDEAAPDTYPRIDRTWPESEGLLGQSGPFDLDVLGGRAALVTFAFGHCATICPVIVRQTIEVRRRLGRDVSIVVITLDPWRDTPNRLEGLVGQFGLDPERDFVVSGPVDAVNAALDAWNIPRERDSQSGDVTHPALVYMVEADGTVAYASTGGIVQMESLARRLR